MNMQAYEDRITVKSNLIGLSWFLIDYLILIYFIQYLLEIQEIMSLSTDSSFYRVITDLKYRGVNSFSKEEF